MPWSGRQAVALSAPRLLGRIRGLNPVGSPAPERSAIRPALCYSSGSRVIAPASWGKGGVLGAVEATPPRPELSRSAGTSSISQFKSETTRDCSLTPLSPPKCPPVWTRAQGPLTHRLALSANPSDLQPENRATRLHPNPASIGQLCQGLPRPGNPAPICRWWGVGGGSELRASRFLFTGTQLMPATQKREVPEMRARFSPLCRRSMWDVLPAQALRLPQHPLFTKAVPDPGRRDSERRGPYPGISQGSDGSLGNTGSHVTPGDESSPQQHQH